MSMASAVCWGVSTIDNVLLRYHMFLLLIFTLAYHVWISVEHVDCHRYAEYSGFMCC